ncbi:TraY domain-containing protein [Photobacterium sp. R1]
MSKSKSDTDSAAHGAYVTCSLNNEFNDLLDAACALSGRSKKKEVELRLRDSLKRYKTISEVGHANHFE